jgi:ABC-type uncharacterized transport system permease subunit
MDSIAVILLPFLKLLLLSMVPYIFASQGTMLSGRTGVFNVAQEGIMLVGASAGFLAAYESGSLVVGVAAALTIGALFGLALAYFTTHLKMDQFVIGLALFFIAVALSTLLPKLVIGVTLTPPIIPTLPNLPIPLLSKIPLVGDIIFNQNLMVYAAILLSFGLYYFLYKTSFGLSVRAVGENPMAADSLGVNVVFMRYLTAILGGALIALGGVYLPMVYTGTFTTDMVRGRGWISIALTFFGGWSPIPIFFGSLFFAGIDVLAQQAQVGGIGVPYQFLQMLPFIATILVMIISFRRARVPAFLGQNYDREKRSIA